MDNLGLANLSKTTVAVGIAGAMFLGYCFYFDQKRRRAPDFKKKLHERRAADKENRKKTGRKKMPNLSDHEAVQRYFLHEIQMGEALISSGDIERGVEHLSNAVIVCGQPAQLLQVSTFSFNFFPGGIIQQLHNNFKAGFFFAILNVKVQNRFIDLAQPFVFPLNYLSLNRFFSLFLKCCHFH